MIEPVQSFVSWALEHLPELRDKPAEEAADAIGDAILKVDQGLGVEVSSIDENEDRELIVTAFSDAILFPLVRQIVELLSGVPGWRVIALKPPRGFEFSITVGTQRMRAKTLRFTSIPTIVGGIQLLVAKRILSDMPVEHDCEELAWLIVETGIGEELSSKLQHIEFASAESAKEKQPITKLAEFVSNRRV